MLLDDFLKKGRDNNLNLLRFLAASLVVYSHSFGIFGFTEPLLGVFPQGISFGSLAVNIFFILSGFLIAQSWDRRQELIGFLYARVIRIYPALIFSVVFCALFIGPIYTSLSLYQYITDLGFYKFILENSTLLPLGVYLELPGVFETNISSSNVNTPIWTLPYELKMYLLLALFGFLGVLRNKLFILLFTSIFCFLYIFKDITEVGEVSSIYRFIAFFFLGVTFFLFREKIVLRFKYVVILAMICFISWYFLREYSLYVLFIALPYFLIWIAFVPNGSIRKFNHFGDYSYGIYIYAFPIQQVLSSYDFIESPLTAFLIAIVLTLIMAVASWHFLEEKCLSSSNNVLIQQKIKLLFSKFSFGFYSVKGE